MDDVAQRRMKRPTQFAFVIALCLSFDPSRSIAQSGSQMRLVQLLSKQGFSGPLKGEMRFSEMGNLLCGGNSYRVIYHEWYESNPPGKAIHGSHRLVLLKDGTRYVGSYVVEERPIEMTPATVRFDYPANLGNTISCKDGRLPTNVLLNGMNQALEK
jgi:hypothetical protein